MKNKEREEKLITPQLDANLSTFPKDDPHLELKYLFFQAFDPLAMGLLPRLQGSLCLELTVSETIRL